MLNSNTEHASAEIRSGINQMAATKAREEMKELAIFIFKQMCEEAERVFGDKLIDCYLFGSYAKDTFHEDSDVDICVVLDCPRKELHKYYGCTTEKALDLLCEHDIDPQVFTCSKEQYEHSISMIYDEIKKWGISWKTQVKTGL